MDIVRRCNFEIFDQSEILQFFNLLYSDVIHLVGFNLLQHLVKLIMGQFSCQLALKFD